MVGRRNFRTKTTMWIDSLNSWIDSNHIRQNRKGKKYDEEWYVSSEIWNDSNCLEDDWYNSKLLWIDSD